MGLAYQPDFQLIANGNDITQSIKDNLLSLAYTDNSGKESDRLTFAIAASNGMKTPPKGAVIKLALGFNGELVDKGQFVVDEISPSGPPRKLQFTAHAAPMNNSKQSGVLQTQKTRSWDNVILGDVVKTVANDHGLVARVNSELNGIHIEHLDQVNESDMNLLSRLAQTYYAVSKPANGYWLFLKEGEAKSVSGKDLTDITLRPENVTSWQGQFGSRTQVKRVIAIYNDVATGEVKEVSVGTGQPEFRIVYKYPNYAEASAAVQARSKNVTSGSDTMDITMPATSELIKLIAEGTFTLENFGDIEDGKWRITSIEWSLSDAGMQIRLSGDHGIK